MNNNKQNEGSVKHSSTPQTDLSQKVTNQLFETLLEIVADTSFITFYKVRKALEKKDIEQAWVEFRSEREDAMVYFTFLEKILGMNRPAITGIEPSNLPKLCNFNQKG